MFGTGDYVDITATKIHINSFKFRIFIISQASFSHKITVRYA